MRRAPTAHLFPEKLYNRVFSWDMHWLPATIIFVWPCLAKIHNLIVVNDLDILSKHSYYIKISPDKFTDFRESESSKDKFIPKIVSPGFRHGK
jgi:hypothetical protein